MCCFPNWLVREQSKTIRLKVGVKLLITEDHIPNIVFIFSSPRLKQKPNDAIHILLSCALFQVSEY